MSGYWKSGIGRAIASAYVSQADPTVGELTEVKTAVSKLSAMRPYTDIRTKAEKMEFNFISDDTIMIKVTGPWHRDRRYSQSNGTAFYHRYGTGQVRYGIYGNGGFMDKIKVDSRPGQGTTVTMIKKLDTYYGF